MDEKAVAIRDHLLKGMPEREIHFQHFGVGDLYKFRIEGKPLVSDSEPADLVNWMNVYRVVTILNEAEKYS